MTLQKPKGTEDYYPAEKLVQDELFSRFKSVCSSYGYGPVEVPAFETMELLTKKSGEEVKSQIFNLEKKGSEEFGLRFEGTAGITRMFIEKQKALTKPVKWCYTGRMWRYEQPQKGRLREFYQLGVELFGSDAAAADAEVISIIIDYFKALGLSEKDFFIKINNRAIIESVLKDVKNKEEAMRLIDKKAKMKKDEFEKGLNDLGIGNVKDVLSIKTVSELEKLDLNDAGKVGVENLKKILSLVDQKFVRLDLSTVRGLAYYTGTVFEAYDAEEKYRALAGGGRYNDMVKLFGGQDEPATGFAIGESPLMLLLNEKNLVPKVDAGVEYYVAPIGEVAEKANEIAAKLRAKASVEIDLVGRNLGNQMKYASAIGAKNIVIVGEKDLENNEVTVKDLSSGEEKKVKVDEL